MKSSINDEGLMVRSDPRQRKDIVLGMVVQQYIRTDVPVSSAYIADEYAQEISSATIRNILADLESDGYLTHPHTSAGRIPTQRGYRYFVDFLMREIVLVEEERRRIHEEYEQHVLELELLMERTSAVISELTHCASIVTVEGYPRTYLFRGTNYLAEAVGAQGFHKIACILKMLEEKERILEVLRRDLDKKIKIYIGHETACKDFDDCAMAVSHFRMRGGASGHIAVLGSTRMDYERVVSALEYVSELMRERG
jgi:transcriptional regulator of heat shock response